MRTSNESNDDMFKRQQAMMDKVRALNQQFQPKRPCERNDPNFGVGDCLGCDQLGKCNKNLEMWNQYGQSKNK